MNDDVGKPIKRASLYRKLWRWLPHNDAGARLSPPGSPHFDRNKLDDLTDSFGIVKVERPLSRSKRNCAAASSPIWLARAARLTD